MRTERKGSLLLSEGDRSSGHVLPLQQSAACLSWRWRTLCSGEPTAGRSGAARSSRESRCPPWSRRREGKKKDFNSPLSQRGSKNFTECNGFTAKQNKKSQYGGVRLLRGGNGNNDSAETLRQFQKTKKRAASAPSRCVMRPPHASALLHPSPPQILATLFRI